MRLNVDFLKAINIEYSNAKLYFHLNDENIFMVSNKSNQEFLIHMVVLCEKYYI